LARKLIGRRSGYGSQRIHWNGMPPVRHCTAVVSLLMNRRVRHVFAVGTATVLLATGCDAPPPPTTPITVYAASSLIGSFTAIGKEFEAQNPGYSVEFIFAGSADLVGALTDGATADVFASGDRADITALAEAGTAPVPFAANDLVIATAAGNPRNITTLADLARPGLRVAVCAERSACGTALGAAEARDKVRLQPRSADDTPGNILKAIASGQVDAGVVLRTNALGAGDNVSWFALPGAAVTSWVTVIKGTERAHEAAQFVAALTGEGGRKILAANGFVPPVSRAAG
jgi:molybdate transport system substrate-binding protein